ncbi:MAG: nicotinate (nicotinamide) nucleotide adenylyltransferase [Oscillospiraceae bacterium]|nr:nicotinate (nicotinamide) nucleotide adenylyltransferase [Oscillospiraceae bacterium]
MSKTNGSQAGKPPEGHVGNIGKTPESHVGKPPQSLVGFFGGSFNPPHNGHVSAALRAIDALGLDKLVVMTAREAPHKQLPPGSPPPEHRLAMARLAFEHLPRCEVSDWEIRRAAPTYTVDTLAHLRAGGGIPVLVVGSDMFLTLHEWKRTDEFLPVTRVAVLLRDALQGGHVRHYASFLSERYGTDVDCVVHTPVVISSTQLRAALGTGGGRDHLPAAVYEYIVANGLYRRPW